MDLLQTPTVSAVVIARDEQMNIESCLASLCAQTVATLLEIIVVDGNSVDRTPALVEKAAEQQIESAGRIDRRDRKSSSLRHAAREFPDSAAGHRAGIAAREGSRRTKWRRRSPSCSLSGSNRGLG